MSQMVRPERSLPWALVACRRALRAALVLALGWLAVGCGERQRKVEVEPPGVVRPPEVASKPLTLLGPLADRDSEISGLAWQGERLIVLPQYPSRFEGGPDGAIFAVSRQALEAAIDRGAPIDPTPIPLSAPGLEDAIDGFEGFEAVVFDGERAWLTVEASGGGMVGYLVPGRMGADGLTLDAGARVALKTPTALSNMAYEALLRAPDGTLVAFYEANGAGVNPNPRVLRVGPDGGTPAPAAMVPLEYRVTDVTDLDAQGRFWAINYFWPGNGDLKVEAEPLAARYGVGATHAASEAVERLVELSLASDGSVSLVDRAPIPLALGEEPRNWEGIARLPGRGLLIATDKFPQTLLHFVPLP